VLVSLLLACLLFFLLQFLLLLRVSKGIEKGTFKLPSETEQKRLNTHHRIFFVFNLFGETLGCQIYLFFLLGFVWNGFNLQFDQNLSFNYGSTVRKGFCCCAEFSITLSLSCDFELGSAFSS
jgi:hypothetical protein